ncbi:MAG: matrixin family metalloprotease [Planctomycetes bacterium]|nr:matrixin family metalloprotease [Planctomycetota bacterium]
MKIQQLALPTIALGVAAILVFPKESVGFSTIGGSLNLSQRDVRVFNNFSDATANNNVTTDVNWPGQTGAPMSIWKACSEWASELHGGTGAGDPLQTVGSGGADFDITWQGIATGSGGTNDNIHSELQTGTNPSGVLAFTETPISTGWRIFYYDWWTWQDGPGNVTSGIDLQGVACHEYGHALGLGHSAVGGATMAASITGTGTGQRSLATDDMSGVQFVYGVKSAGKPHIASVDNQNPLTIMGSGFSATGNEVWFTNSTTSAPAGDPRIVVTGVASSGGGTSIVVNIPANAGLGDVLVKSSAGATGAFLSNAFPVDPTAAPLCAPPTVYCTAKVNSQLCVPVIGYVGNPTFTGSPFDVTGAEFLNKKFGLLFYGTQPFGAAFQGGHLCVKSPTKRTPPQSSGGSTTGDDCTGFYTVDFNALIQAGTNPNLISGAFVYCQWWSRDPLDFTGFGTSLSDALSFQICP